MENGTPISYNDLSTKYEFSTVSDKTPIPNILKTSKSSYNTFIQRFADFKQRSNEGLEAILRMYFGDTYVGYVFGICKYNSEECVQRGLTFAVPVYVLLRTEKYNQKIQKYFIGQLPLLTKSGSFIINGIENHIVNQLVRDSGIYINTAYGPQVSTSIKLRGEFGKALQFDQLYSFFIGRKLHHRNTGKKTNVGAYQNVLSLLQNTSVAFKDVAYALTYTVQEFKYTQKGWYLNTDWRYFKDAKYCLNNTYSILKAMNISITHGKLLDKEQYIQLLNTKITQTFLSENKTSTESLNYVLIDIYYKNRKSIFVPEMSLFFGIHNILKLLKYIGKKLDLLYNMEDLLTSLPFLSDLSLYVICIQEKPSHYNSLIHNTIELKKKNLLLTYKQFKASNKPIHPIINHSPFANFKIDYVGRLRINALLGTKNIKSYITYHDIIYIIRYIIQLHKKLIQKEILEEQDLYNRKFNSIGNLLYNCLKVIIQESIRKQHLFLYKSNRNQVPINQLRIQNCQKSFEYLIRFIGRSSLCQYTEQANILSYMTHGRKVSIMGPGGLKNENVSLNMRDVHISNYGRLCPIETPEGKSVGVVTTMSVFTRINALCQMETPYLYVINGCVTNIINYLTLPEERSRYIALATEKLNKDGSFIKEEHIYCRSNYRTIFAKPTSISYMELSPKQMTSISSTLIPFVEHNDGIRSLMGANMQRQAVPLDFLEMPLIGTGMETIIGRDFIGISSYKEHFYNLYRNSYVTIHAYSLNPFLNTTPLSTVSSYELLQSRSTNQKTFSRLSIRNDLFHNLSYEYGYALKNQTLSLGNTLLIGYTSMNGHTYEDSIVISERILRGGFLQSTHLEIYRTIESTENDSYEVIKKILNIPNIDDDGVILLGTPVYKDTVLICKEKRQLINYRKDKLIVYDKSIRYKNKKDGVAIRIDKIFEKDTNVNTQRSVQKPYFSLYTSIINESFKHLLCGYIIYEYQRSIIKSVFKPVIKHNIHLIHLLTFIPRNKWHLHIHKETAVSFSNKLSKHNIITSSLLLYKKLIFKYQDGFLVDKIITFLLKEFIHTETKESIFNIKNKNILKKAIRYLIQHSSFKKQYTQFIDHYLLNIFILNKIYSYVIAYGLYKINCFAFVKNDAMKRNREILKIKKTNVLRMVRITIATKHQIQVGDKLTGRYGNKGVISRILHLEDMPYISEGSPIDVILTPLGVSSRMNIGQLFEAHLGVAAIELGKKLQEFILYANKKKHIQLRQYIFNVYQGKKEYAQLQNLEIKQLYGLYKKLSHGFNLNTPVFDSLSDLDINGYIRKNNLTLSGKYTIFDGITGENLDNKITAGYLYVMKLNHLVDHKMHGRSTGPYNVITQQASKGKSRNGGQRIGEMEVWAFQAYGAAYTLQEMLTFKSDSTVARTNFLQNFIKGKSYKIDVPRTFKLLRDELRVLGMELSFVVKKYKIPAN